MHLTLDSLNHILTVIAVTAFLYSRKNYFRTIIDSHLLPGDIQNNVQEISERIEQKIEQMIKPTDVMGIPSTVLDIDVTSTQKLLKVKEIATGISAGFKANNYEKLKKKQSGDVDKINNRFVNTSFFIALLAFLLLILAAGFKEDDFKELKVFLITFDIISFFIIGSLSFRKSSLNNGIIILYFLFALTVSILVSLIHPISNAVYTFYSDIMSSEIVTWGINNWTPGSPFSFLLVGTLFLLLTPWIYCFIRFLVVYFTTSKRIAKEEKPALIELKKLEDYLETEEKLRSNNNANSTANSPSSYS